MNTMGWFTWMIVGGVKGWLVNSMWGLRLRYGLLINVLAGVVGAVIGGLAFYRIGTPDAVTFNIWSLTLAFFGAVVLLLVIRLIPNIAGEKTLR